MNKQPFYHTASFLFTATRQISDHEMAAVLDAINKIPDVIDARGGTQLEYMECEPGDPADLM